MTRATPEETFKHLGRISEFPAEKSPRIAGVTATPFKWVAPEDIPPRRFLFASRYHIAGHVTASAALGGVGKSSFILGELLAHATRRNLLNDAPLVSGKSWYLGLEDPRLEHQRRVAAFALLHNLSPLELENRFFLDDAEQNFVIVRENSDGVKIVEPVVDSIIEQIRRHSITFLGVDPFVACHSVKENDNGAIDLVVRTWIRIAHETGCGIDLVHHLRKGNGNGSDPTVDDFRGGSALIPAVRAARLFVPMSKAEGEIYGIAADYPRFFKVIDAKRNMAPRSAEPRWFQLTAMDLRNGGEGPGDHVAAVEPWTVPDSTAFASVEELEAIKQTIAVGQYRADFRAKTWVGNAVAQVLNLDLRDQRVRKDVDGAVKGWVKDKVLKVERRRDPKERKDFEYVEVARCADENL